MTPAGQDQPGSGPERRGPGRVLAGIGALRSGTRRLLRPAAAVARRTPFPRPTTRGWALLAVGVGLVGGGLAATTSVAVSGGLLLLVLLVLGVVVALVVAAPLSGSRSTARSVIEVGEAFREQVTLRGSSAPLGPRAQLLVRERFDDTFAVLGDEDVLVDIGPSVPPARLEFEAIAAHRGRAVVGPLTIRVEDPFGLLRIDRAVVPAEEVVVVPQSVPLTALDTGALAGAVSADEGRVGQGGSADDSELRPYRPGDPIRRVHWGQSARRGELHVRQTAQAQPPEAVIAIDLRRSAYQQLGREDIAELADLGGDAAFEHAVVVAASVARALAARTSRVVLVSDTDGSTARRRSDDAGGLMDVLVGLADVRVRSDARDVVDVLPDVRGRDANGMTAVVTGHCTPEQAASLVSMTSAGGRGILATIVPPDAAVRGILDRAGWRVLVVPVPGAAGRTVPAPGRGVPGARGTGPRRSEGHR